MITKRFVLHDKMGLHARPAAALMMALLHMDAKVEIAFGGKRTDGRDIMGMMDLEARAGDEVTFTVHGPQEREAMEKVEELMKMV